MENKLEADFGNIVEVINEIMENHSDKIKGNQAFTDLLHKLSEENDKKNAVLEDMAEAIKMLSEQVDNCFKHYKDLMKLAELNSKTNEYQDKDIKTLLDLIDNLQGQVDILAKDNRNKASYD